MNGYRYNERALVLGSTGSGKSEVLNWLAAQLRCQLFLLDTKDEFALPGVEPVSRVDAIDWGQRIVHFRPPADVAISCDPKKGRCGRCFNCIFRACYVHDGPLVVIVHELGDVCDYNAGKTPKWCNAYISKGRARGKGIIMGSQRPMSVPTRALGESEHVLMVGERFSLPQDHQKVSEAMGQNPRELGPLIDHVQQSIGGEPDPDGRTHAFLHFNRKRRQITACPPLPPEHRAAIQIGRTLEPNGLQADEKLTGPAGPQTLR